jgi:type III secretion protein C
MNIRLKILSLFTIILLFFAIARVYADKNYSNAGETVKEVNFLNKRQPFYFIARGVSVEEVMQGFSHNYRVKVSVSDKIDININKTFEAFSAMSFLNEFCLLYNLTWYFDGNILYVTAISENTSVMLTLNNVTIAQLKAAAKDTGIWDDRFKWKEIPEQSIVYVFGPPRYVSLIKETLKIVDLQRARLEEKNLEVAIIKLKHIAVSDEVVKLLQKMFIDDKSVLYKGSSGVEAQEASEMSGKKAKNLGAVLDVAASNHPPLNSGIEAIDQLNAILVRDTPQRIEIYKFLINELDKPQRQIEISLSIIDIRVSKSEDLGILWDITKGLDKDSNLGITLNTDLSAKGVASGNPFTLVGKETADFISRVSILHREGNAKYASRPAVLTQDNTTANLNFDNIIHIPLSSKYSNTIQTITFGTSLKITPRIIDFSAHKKVSLKIEIQDGKQGQSSAQGELPMINNVTINTMATINEGESLLIGGYYTDSTIDKVNKLPILGDLPIIGLLFKDRSNKKVKFMRMFLLQPRIIYSTFDKSNKLYAERDKLLKQIEEAREANQLITSKDDEDIWSDSVKEKTEHKKTITQSVAVKKPDRVKYHEKSVEVTKEASKKQQPRRSKPSSFKTEYKVPVKGYDKPVNTVVDLNRLQNKYIDFRSIFPCYTKDKAKLLINKNDKNNIYYSEIDCLTSDGVQGIRIITKD